MLRYLCVAMVAMLMTASAIRYTLQIKRRQIEPATSSWLVFMAGTALSFITYMLASDRDVVSGIMNTMDVCETGTIMVAVMLWGNTKGVRFSRFEKWYLAGIGVIVAYGFIFGDAWGSNLFVQVLIGLGYVPTVHKIVTLKRNTESFTAWSFSWFASIFAMVPALWDGNTLAAVYAARSFVCVSLFLGLMTWYKYIYPRRRAAARISP